MPIYQYRCLDCGSVSEHLLPLRGDESRLACTHCGGKQLFKLISAPALVRTGSATKGATCCGREERCESPPCSTGGNCRRH